MSEQTNLDIRALKPQHLWNHFADLNAVPRPSKKEERVIAFMRKFGEDLQLETEIDAAGNVLIRKPATPGMEHRAPVVLQSHLDMVHQKNSDTIFDFEQEGIKMMVEGDWVKAQGTTLGADNGIGVAAMMSVLASDSIAHPAVEALFTIDEETGMTGAQELQPGFVRGKILLNLDTEEDDEIDIGCAGGIDVTSTKQYQEIDIPSDWIHLEIALTGLQGGHSGMDIHKGFGNANKIMNALLMTIEDQLCLVELKGGSLRNAIPRESFAKVAIAPSHLENLKNKIEAFSHQVKGDFAEIEPNLTLSTRQIDGARKGMAKEEFKAFTRAVDAAINGVFKMSPDIPDLVEASNNISKIGLGAGQISVECLTRSSVDASKVEVANALKTTFDQAGFETSFSGSYPGWSPNRDSAILTVLEERYEEVFQAKPRVVACHAGLECGLIGQHYPEMDMISFGPTILGAHSPDERASISSVAKFWTLLVDVLAHIPEDK